VSGTRPNGGAPAAVLFHMDGLLVDSEPLWTIAENEIAASLGGVFTPTIKAAMIGQALPVAVPILLEGLDTPAAREADPSPGDADDSRGRPGHLCGDADGARRHRQQRRLSA